MSLGSLSSVLITAQPSPFPVLVQPSPVPLPISPKPSLMAAPVPAPPSPNSVPAQPFPVPVPFLPQPSPDPVTILVSLSGRGDKDVDHIRRTLAEHPEYVVKDTHR